MDTNTKAKLCALFAISLLIPQIEGSSRHNRGSRTAQNARQQRAQQEEELRQLAQEAEELRERNRRSMEILAQPWGPQYSDAELDAELRRLEQEESVEDVPDGSTIDDINEELHRLTFGNTNSSRTSTSSGSTKENSSTKRKKKC